MLLCYICKKVVGKEIRDYQVHISNHNRLGEILLPYQCVQPGCHRSYAHVQSFWKHFRTHHPNDRPMSTPSTLVGDTEMSSSQVSSNIPCSYDNLDVWGDSSQVVNCDETADQKQLLEDKCCHLIADLRKDSACTQKLLDIISCKCNDIVNLVLDIAKQTLKDVVSQLTKLEQQSCIIKNFDESTQCLYNPFSLFETEYKRRKYFESKGYLIKPISYQLGYRFELRRNKSNKSQWKKVVDSFQFVPLDRTLQLLFSNKFLQRNIIISSAHKSELCNNGVIMNSVFDGRHAKNLQKLIKDDFIAIEIYYDDVETANPLGTKTVIHKLGLFYFVIKNLPSYFNSSYPNIHLLAVGRLNDFKRYGFRTVLETIRDAIKPLEKDGIELPWGDGKKRFRVILFNFVGDNLGLHAVLGFNESFNSVHFCRFCLADRKHIQNYFVEDCFEMRNKFLYDQLFESGSREILEKQGIKHSCPLNDLQHFHIFENYSADLMHDVCEGLGQYVLALVLNNIVFKKKILTLEEINELITGFSYGRNDRKNRPCEIPRERIRNPTKKKNLKLKSAQFWCLLRLIPLIIGSKVSKNDETWLFLQHFFDLSDLLFAPSIPSDCLVQLREMIKDHMVWFQKIFPGANFIPKYHFLIHYPRIVEFMGPLYWQWCMKYEMKHNFFKRSAHIVCNFVNLPFTMAMRHQFYQAFVSLSCRNQKDVFEVISGDTVQVSRLEAATDIASFFGVRLDSTTFTSSKVSYCGTEYSIGDIVVLEIINFVPQFGLIMHCVFMNSKWFLVVQSFTTSHFDKHYHCYVCNKNNKVAITDVTKLAAYRPLDYYEMKGVSGYFIRLHYHII